MGGTRNSSIHLHRVLWDKKGPVATPRGSSVYTDGKTHGRLVGTLTPGTVNEDMPLGSLPRPICSVKHLLNCVKRLAKAVPLIDNGDVNAVCVPVPMPRSFPINTSHFQK